MTFPNVQPELKVELSVVDTPLGDDPASYYGIVSFGGWQNITSDVRSVSIDRGRSNDLEKVGTGTASIKLSNAQRQYDPLNTSGPYYDVLSSTSYLRPRNQVRVFGVYPNDPTVDGYCYNLQDETTRTPSAAGYPAGTFTAEGWLSPPIQVPTEVDLTSTLNKSGLSSLTTIARIAPQYYNWGQAGLTYAIAEVSGTFYISIDSGVVRLHDTTSGSPNIVATWYIPSHISSTTKPFWLKVVASSSAGGHQCFYCDDQFQVPSTWTELSAASNTSGITMSGTNTTVEICPFSVMGVFTYWSHTLKRLQVFGDSTQYIDLLCDTHISLFQGYVAGWPQEYEMMGKDPTITLSCFDSSGLLGNMKVPSDLLEVVIPPTNPWGWWKLGDAADTCVDYSGNDHDLTYTPTGAFDHVSDIRISDGLSGVATNFAPSSLTPPYIASGHKAPQVNNNWSISLWVLTDQQLYGVDTARIITFDDESSTFFTKIALNNGTTVSDRQMSKIYVQVDDAVNSPTAITSTNYVTDGLPHHVCVTYNSSTGVLKMYIDGSVTKGTTAFAATGMTHGGFISMGRSSPNIYELNVVPYRGALQDVVYWNNRELSALEVQDIYNAGYGYIDESSGARMERILDYAGFPTRLRNIDISTYGTCGAVEYTEDQALLELMQKVEDTEVGILFTNRSGLLTMRGRYYLSMADTGINSQANFDDENTNIGYRGLRFSYDAEQLVNDHVIVDDVGAEYQSDDSTSVTDYGRRSRTISTLLNDTTSARNMAIGLTNIYKQPILKAEPFEILPLYNDWLKVLPLDIGDRVNLKATPMNIPPQISQDLALQSISYDIQPKNWQVRIIGSPRPVITYFVLDSSELDGPDVLGF